MASSKTCALCGSQAALVESHIIPKFVGDWIKETSATPYIRQAAKPNLRRQDIVRLKLLCPACEQVLSKCEKEFAEKIFRPLNERRSETFQYEEWLMRFVISLSWRIATVEMEGLRASNPPMVPSLEQALSCWRNFLLGVRSDPGPYAHHMFFADFLEDSTTMAVPPKFQWYLMRAIDGTIVASKSQVHVYTKLPRIIIVSGVRPAKPRGWKRTRIRARGRISSPQEIAQPGFADFLRDRVKFVNNLMSKMSDRQKAKIDKAVTSDPHRLLNCPAGEVLLAELYWDQRARGGED